MQKKPKKQQLRNVLRNILAKAHFCAILSQFESKALQHFSIFYHFLQLE
jgi:hypothetical protein